MASFLRLDINLSKNAADVVSDLRLSTGVGSKTTLSRLLALIEGCVAGAFSSAWKIVTGAVRATGTVTFSSWVATDTVTVGAVVLTGSATPANENQFLSTGNDAADAVAFAACVNAHSVLSKIVSVATPTTATATITCLVPGAIGNQVGLAISAHGSVSAATLTGGVDGTSASLSCGL